MYERYRFIKQLPSGGFGNVTILFDKQLKREVVVKSLIDSHREVEQLSAQQHDDVSVRELASFFGAPAGIRTPNQQIMSLN